MLPTIKNKLKDYFKKNIKLILFIIVLVLVCLIYNQNLQTLNYFFKRGIVLEYSYPKKYEFNISGIEKKLIDLNIKYSSIEDIEQSQEMQYDADDEPIEKTLSIALPILADESKVSLINSISDYIFENYPKSKLIDIHRMNDYYAKPYSAFLKTLGIIFTSLFIWVVLLYCLFADKNILNNFFINLKDAFFKQKQNFSNFIKKTKEKGFGYFIKCILFDDAQKDDKELDVTKEIVTTIVFVIVAVIAIRYFIGELRWIPSGSMRPTILEHDRVFVEKLDYPLKKEIKRGDILVFYPPAPLSKLSNTPWAVFARLSGIFCKDIAYIKRVVGMPNDKFEIKYDENNQEYRVYINDVALSEPYINSRKNWTSCDVAQYCGPFTIPENKYFMMGDNRGNSQDSRFWGFLDKERIIGRANFMFFPIPRINLLNDKYLLLNKQKNGSKTARYNYLINRY